jgi:hypothetical protein
MERFERKFESLMTRNSKEQKEEASKWNTRRKQQNATSKRERGI